ncbi:hypothetical protein F5884DRAFT_859775 [Xylogone sp. PMI_703]|nr:hypothetical protein F5884DRAFT_859775 [Xylogone sp. PMI_703]
MSTPNLMNDRSREAPVAESRMDSVRRRLSTFRRRMSVDERQLGTAVSIPSTSLHLVIFASNVSLLEIGAYTKSVRRDPGIDKALTYTDTKNGSNVVVSEYGTNGYDQEITIWRGDEENHDGPDADLSDWAGRVNETMANMDALRQSFGELQVKFGMHLRDLDMVQENKKRLAFYEQQCREKDDQIQRQLATISTLTKISMDHEKKMAEEQNRIEDERKELDREKLERERRTEATIAREKKILQEEFEKNMASHSQSHEDRRRQMEDDFKRQKEEANRRMAAVDAENKQLSKTLQEQSQRLHSQENKLKRSVQRTDALQQYINSYKKELEDKEKELGMMKSAFTPRYRSLDDVKTQFTKISAFIEEISMKYFTDPIEGDPGSVHEELVAADPAFMNVPIDESEVSYNLRIVHAQRVISEALCEYIWRPFRSDYTLANEELASCLFQMMKALDNSGLAGQPANIWTALTMRALDLLPEVPTQKSAANLPPPAGRAKSVIAKVYGVLSPLLTASKGRSFAGDLSALTDLAIDVWQTAQTGDYRVKVISKLDPARYQEWRSQAFDPTTMQGNRNAVSNDIFLLFPRVEATMLSGKSDRAANSPRSSPSRTPGLTDVCLHTGKGLPHSCELVLHGIQVQEDINNYIENAKREARMKRYSGMNNSRRASNAAPRLSHPSKQYEQAALAS